MPVFLVPLDKGPTVSLDKAVTLFGRHPDCDVVLTKSRKVSRKHCCVAQVNDRLVVRDLGSMNGVRVNGERISTQCPLDVGDELAVGDVRYTLADRSAATGAKSDNRVSQSGGKPLPPIPHDLSQEIPVAISDQEESFLVEASQVAPRAEELELVDVDDDHEDEDDELIVIEDDDVLEIVELEADDIVPLNDDDLID